MNFKLPDDFLDFLLKLVGVVIAAGFFQFLLRLYQGSRLMEKGDAYYYRKLRGRGSEVKGPFCKFCWHNEFKLLPLFKFDYDLPVLDQIQKGFKCRKCEGEIPRF